MLQSYCALNEINTDMFGDFLSETFITFMHAMFGKYKIVIKAMKRI